MTKRADWAISVPPTSPCGPVRSACWRPPPIPKRRAFKAIAVLGWFGEPAKTALPVLLQKFKAGRDIWFAAAAASSIGAMGPAAREAVPVLAEFVSKEQAAPPENPTQRELLDSASAALQKIGRVEEEPVAGPRRP